MKFVIFGLAVSSSWGNGHATLWRGLVRALGSLGHTVVFFERNVDYYATSRDLIQLAGGELVLYDRWEAIRREADRHLADADAAIITSYCPDALPATNLVLDSRVPVKAFYDLDTGVTLDRLQKGESVPYIGPRGLRDFDLVLSYVGGPALDAIKTQLGARRVAPLYGSVDPAVHHPAPPIDRYRSDLSYLGTFAEDRQAKLERLLVEPAHRLPDLRFMMGGALYPDSFPWTANTYFVYHVPPREHAAFYSSSRLTLNVTRGAMARFGYCPSARLFEAAACGVPVVTDEWQGLGQFYVPGEEILVARTTQDVVDALELPRAELARIGKAARTRTLEEHTAERRASDLERLIDSAKDNSFHVQPWAVEGCCHA